MHKNVNYQLLVIIFNGVSLRKPTFKDFKIVHKNRTKDFQITNVSFSSICSCVSVTESSKLIVQLLAILQYFEEYSFDITSEYFIILHKDIPVHIYVFYLSFTEGEETLKNFKFS